MRGDRYRNFAYEDRPGRIQFWQRRCDTADGRRDIWYATPHPSYPTNATKALLRKPSSEVADRCLYTGQSPEVSREVWETLRGGGGSGDELVWCEGESDVDAVLEEDWPAVTHHGGAVALAKLGQARALRKFRGTVYVAVDLDDAGARCAVERVRLLYLVGFPSTRVELIGPAGFEWAEKGGADLRDHLALGRSLTETRELRMTDLRGRADRAIERRASEPATWYREDDTLRPLVVSGRDGERVQLTE